MQNSRIVKPGEPVPLYDALKMKSGAISGHVILPARYCILADIITEYTRKHFLSLGLTNFCGYVGLVLIFLFPLDSLPLINYVSASIKS